MKLLIHDLSETTASQFLSISNRNEYQIVCQTENAPVKCIGCFSCWKKNPGECVLKDGYQHMGEYFGNCESITVITDMRYGEFSCFTKNILDRSISAVHPHFTKRNGGMHHKLRYTNRPALHVICHSDDITPEEKELFQIRVQAASINLGCNKCNLSFCDGIKEKIEL